MMMIILIAAYDFVLQVRFESTGPETKQVLLCTCTDSQALLLYGGQPTKVLN